MTVYKLIQFDVGEKLNDFFTDNAEQALVALSKLPHEFRVEIVSMTQEEYMKIPATISAHNLFAGEGSVRLKGPQ